MPNIAYVCISDLHLGEEHSLLTNLPGVREEVDYSKPSPVMVQFVECLRDILQETKNSKKPTLILNGDLLELAFCEMNRAAMVFRHFVRLIMPKDGEPLFNDIIFVPGNHDHHLWEMARETQYVNFLRRHPGLEELRAPWHTTSLFLREEKHPVNVHFLTNLVREHLRGKFIRVAYPNLAILDRNASKCVVFHHGHFTEWIYWLISDVKNELFGLELPIDVWDLEAENFAWIDFFWSALGRSGKAGRGLETIYDKLLDPKAIEGIIDKAAGLIIGNMCGKTIERPILAVFLNQLVRRYGGTERSRGDSPLSDDGHRYLSIYIEDQLRRHLADKLLARELKVSELPKQEQHKLGSAHIPETTFVFGHTHKPYSDCKPFNGYNKPVKVYNTGGWVVDSLEPQESHGGAIVLVDDNLDAVAVTVYKEAQHKGDYAVSIDCASPEHQQETKFLAEIRELVDTSAASWKRLSEVIADAVAVRREHLNDRVHGPN